MKKVLWLSRHRMTEDQQHDLSWVVGGLVEITSRDVVWSASSFGSDDYMSNLRTFTSMVKEMEASMEISDGRVIIAGVFPPVLMETINRAIDSGEKLATYEFEMWSPVSKQTVEMREGEKIVKFQHLRWCRVFRHVI